MVEVRQEDRLAAMQIYQRFWDHDYVKWIGDGTNAGGDGYTVIQAFARHRIAALEEAAKVADELDDEVLRGHDYGERASSRIRALKGPTDDPA
jgi:hypothetical protein